MLKTKEYRGDAKEYFSNFKSVSKGSGEKIMKNYGNNIKNDAPNVSIVLLNYNGFKDTIECLDSIFRMNYKNFQVVIVDNGSSDNFAAKMKKWMKKNEEAREKLFIVEQRQNLGFARGNNVGIKYALSRFESEYVLILNNDTIVGNDFLFPLIEVFKNYKDVALAGPRIIEPKIRWQGYLSKRINLLTYISCFTSLRNLAAKTPFSIEFYLKNMNKPKKVYAIPGCCMLFKASALEEINLFDEETFLGWEEYIIAEKLFSAGYGTYVAPKSIIQHKVARDTAKISKAIRRNAYLNSERYFQNHYLKMSNYKKLMIKIIRWFFYYIEIFLTKYQILDKI